GDKGVVPFYLAQLAEETKHYDEAIARYRDVTEGDRAWLAKLRIGAMIAKKGDITAARTYLKGLQPESAERRAELAQAEAQILRDAGDFKSAYAVLAAALERQA